MPFADYKDFDDCVKKNKDKSDPAAYCASIKNKVEGKDSIIKYNVDSNKIKIEIDNIRFDLQNKAFKYNIYNFGESQYYEFFDTEGKLLGVVKSLPSGEYVKANSVPSKAKISYKYKKMKSTKMDDYSEFQLY